MEMPNGFLEETGRETQKVSRSSSWLPNALTMIRKRIMVAWLGIVVVFLCLISKLTELPIQWQPSSSGSDVSRLCWPKAYSYLFLTTELSVLSLAILFLITVPPSVVAWILLTVGYYIWNSVRIGQERKTAGHKKLMRKSAHWAMEMLQTTIRYSVNEVKKSAIPVFLALLPLAWMLGKFNILLGQSCN